MAGFNGNGTFDLRYDWTDDKTNSIKVTASRFDQTYDDFKAGFEQCMTTTGETTVTQNIPFNSKKITGLGDGTDHTDAINMGQIQDSNGVYYTSTGSANAYVLTPAPPIAAYVSGQRFIFNANFGNTGSATLNVSTIGAKTLKKNGGGDNLESGDIPSGAVITAIYDGTNFQVVNIKLRGLESFIIAASDEATDLVVGTNKVKFRMPYAFTVSEVRASVGTAPTGSTIIVDINESGSTILSTKLTIDATEKTSTTAATPAVISDAALADDAEITIDFDQVGSTITGGGLKITLLGRRT